MTIFNLKFKKLPKSEKVGLLRFQTKNGKLHLVNKLKKLMDLKHIFLINKKTLFNISDTFYVKL